MAGKNLLFVCLGNICRSPAAEAVMTGKIEKSGLASKIKCDSAGTIGFHSGERADGRMRRHALKRGYPVTSISRRINPVRDFINFDMVIAMDDQNIEDLFGLAPTDLDRKKIFRMTDFRQQLDYDLVPDPYYGGDDGFELVLDILEDACDGLLDYLQKLETRL